MTRNRFVPGLAGELFLTEFLPLRQAKKLVILVAPFAEEMNRARRMLHLQAKHLASLGLQVCMPDLFGTGDSDGEFSDASWDIWKSDVKSSIMASSGDEPVAVSLLGLRTGALLALDAVRTYAINTSQLIFWSPCISGELFISQFLRTRLMAGMLARSENSESMKVLRDRLLHGESLEVAGYDLTPSMAASIEALKLVELASAGIKAITWYEMVSDASRPIPPQAERVAIQLRESGIVVDTAAVPGPQFWATADVAVAPELVTLTTATMADQIHQ